MPEPALVIRSTEWEARGALQPRHLAEARRVLEAGGFVMLPSDTAYSVATWLTTTRIRGQVNQLLQRANEPISLAFPSARVARRWTADNEIVTRLLERFTPGPITVVCAASPLIPVAVTRDGLGSLNHTIGVRVPDSVVERQVAGVGSSAITTVPVRDLRASGKPPVTGFEDAVSIIRDRAGAFGGAPWCAIEGEWRHPRTSTVVEILGDGASYALRRQGAIPAEDIRACIEEHQRQADG